MRDSVDKHREKGLPKYSKSFAKDMDRCICGHGTAPGECYCSKCKRLMRKDCD